MTMGLKIHKMLREDDVDTEQLKEAAKRRKDVSDNVLEMIYNKLMDRYRDRGDSKKTDEWEDVD